MGWWESPDHKDQGRHSATTLAQGLTGQSRKKAQCYATFFTLPLLAALSTAELFLSLLLYRLFLLLSLFFLLFSFALFLLRALLLSRRYFRSPQPYRIISP